jgi:glycosyltransferase involved in cell wall biosynthesis
MPKIILDCDLMKHRDSGLYHYCLNLGNAIQKELQQTQNTTDTFNFYIPKKEKSTFAQRSDYLVERKWHKKLFNPALWNCDLWHAPFQSGRILAKPNNNTKILLTIHDLNVLHEDKPAKERRLSLLHTQQLIDKANAIVCISNHCKADVLQHMNVANKKIFVIHNGTHEVAPPPATVKVYRPSKPFAFAIGYVNRKKNFHTLIPLLKNNDIELIVAGRLDEPDYIQQMLNYAQSLGVADRLNIVGPVSEADKAWYYNNCTAFLMPSLAEGFGAPVVEAMRFGKPVFLSNKTSLPEIGGKVSFYFNNFEPTHMQEVFAYGMAEFSKNGLYKKIIEHGATFNWQQKAKDYVAVYKELLRG